MIVARGIDGRGEGAARAKLILSQHNQDLRFVYDTLPHHINGLALFLITNFIIK